MKHRVCLLLVLLGGLPVLAQSPATDAERAELEAVRANAERGNPASQYALGLRYANGVGGVERDPVEALRWYRRSSEQGYVPAQFAVAAMYDRGVGVAEDPVGAVRWYLAAALQGHAGAQHNLAQSYESGRGVVRNEALARTWYERAAEQGLNASQMRIAEMYAEGRGGEANLTAAGRWYRRAAVLGVAAAQARLGLALAEGRGIEPNDREAYLWLEIAARRELDEARVGPARAAVIMRLDTAARDAVRASVEACALAAYYYCGDPIAPPCSASDAHRAVAVTLEPGAHPDIDRPRLLRGVEPQFSREAVVALGQSLDVVLDALVLADGRVGALCVRQSLGAALDGEAVRSARLWEFAPATQNDEGVPAWVRLDLPVRIER